MWDGISDVVLSETRWWGKRMHTKNLNLIKIIKEVGEKNKTIILKALLLVPLGSRTVLVASSVAATPPPNKYGGKTNQCISNNTVRILHSFTHIVEIYFNGFILWLSLDSIQPTRSSNSTEYWWWVATTVYRIGGFGFEHILAQIQCNFFTIHYRSDCSPLSCNLFFVALMFPRFAEYRFCFKMVSMVF